MKNNPSVLALIWAGAITFGAGYVAGLTPVMLNEYDSCGSAWFPGTCVPVVLDSASTMSMVLLLIGAAAGITGLGVRGSSSGS